MGSDENSSETGSWRILMSDDGIIKNLILFWFSLSCTQCMFTGTKQSGQHENISSLFICYISVLCYINSSGILYTVYTVYYGTMYFGILYSYIYCDASDCFSNLDVTYLEKKDFPLLK